MIENQAGRGVTLPTSPSELGLQTIARRREEIILGIVEGHDLTVCRPPQNNVAIQQPASQWGITNFL